MRSYAPAPSAAAEIRFSNTEGSDIMVAAAPVVDPATHRRGAHHARPSRR